MQNYLEILGKRVLSHPKHKQASMQEYQSLRTKDVWNENRRLLLYFGGEFCKPCTTFMTKILTPLYEQVRDKGVDFIYISADFNDTEFERYFAKQPWLAIPYDHAASVREAFRVYRFPTAFVIDTEKGTILTKHGYEDSQMLSSFLLS